MNPTTDPLPPPPQLLPLQLPRSSFSCDRHPDENFSGFCPLCLCERLTTLDQSSNSAAAASSSRRNPTSSAAVLKPLFKPPSSSTVTKIPFFLELRRTKSFSASKNDGLGFFAGGVEPQRKSCDVRGRNTLCSLFSVDDVNKPQHQTQEIEHSEHNIVQQIDEIDVIKEQLKTMQDHIDLDSHSKKPSRSNFWSVATVLGKKWQKWRQKPTKNRNNVVSSVTLNNPIPRQHRDTKSEIADYGFGRRSIDIDPRFSLDAGRISYDDTRRSFDEPRVSWDGYVIGRTFPRLPPMVEDVPVLPVARSDMQMAVEQPASVTDEVIPGGSIQTREYYTDSSSKPRKSLDRSNSIRKMAAAVVAEMDGSHEMTTTTTTAAVSNAKVSPATIDYSYNYSQLGLRFPSIGNERELGRDSNASSLRDDCSETFELGLKDKNAGKKPRRWRWKIWGFIHHRHGGNKDDGNGNGNGVERSYSESWHETGINNRLFRSNSTVSCRHSSYNKKSNSEFVLERNRSVKYSPNHTDSGLLRFYLTPLRGSRRSKAVGNSNNISRNMHRVH